MYLRYASQSPYELLNVRFEVLMTLNMKSSAFWYVMPCSLVDRYQCFGRTCYLHLQSGKLFYRDDGGSSVLQNADIYLASYTM
jgi:hypothetical protein